jgi:hypothetical protein
VLYTVGHAIFDTTCCGVGGCGYATVHGRVRGWQVGRDDQGRPVSEVEPLDDATLRKKLTKLIKAREHVTQVDFR